ncbi:PDR6 [Candida margitis]|uniref:PDR6 n=1 Tax=Candida margitis TaxID=1775924 RepID=UPI00222685F0|nr:PDR6 [Candida margitis]KAI5953866.1 PDR6 [Candida margitis]
MTTQLDLNDVIKDIELLYTSKDADQIHFIQDKLQAYQKSEHGDELGLQLLQHPHSTVKYFGALTITVHLNSFGCKNFEQTFQQISLIIKGLADENFYSNLFIIKKLLSCLSLIYILHYQHFDPIAVFTKLLNPTTTSVAQFITDLQDSKQLELLLYFLSVLVEDVQKIPSSVPELHSAIHATIFGHLQTVLEYLLQQYSQLPEQFILLLLECLNSWVVYASTAEARSEVRYGDDLGIFITLVLKQLDDNFDIDKMELYNKTFTVLAEFVDHIARALNPFKPTLMDIFFGGDKLGMQMLNTIFADSELMETYRLEVDNYINLIISYLELNIIQITRNILHEDTARIIQTVISLTNAPGQPIIEENISFQLVSFWDEFANTLIDDADVLKESFPTLIADNKQRSDEILMEVAISYFKKIQRPSEVVSQEFTRYRVLVADLFIVFYSILGVPIYATLCNTVGPDLIQSEAALYLLHKITVDIQFYDEDDNDEQNSKTYPLVQEIAKIFNKDVIAMVENHIDKEYMTTSLLNFISVLPFFYKSSLGNQFLAPSFDFLFRIITTHKVGSLPLIASRTVYRICQDAEENLIPFLPQLELVLVEMLQNPAIDNVIRERITNSYISIVRSRKVAPEMGDKIFAILQVIDQQKSKIYDETLEDYIISLVACIDEIGKACAYPEEIEDYLTEEQLQQVKAYWNEDPLQIRSMILQNLRTFSLVSPTLAQKTIVTEKCCSILKCGFNEPIIGPFTFDLGLIFQYIIAKLPASTPHSIDYLHQLIISVILTHAKDIDQTQFEELLVRAFVDIQSIIESDEDLIKTSLDVFAATVDTKPKLILYTPSLDKFILPFALSAFAKHEVPIVRSTIKFWNALITMKKGVQQDQEVVRHWMTTEQQNGTCLGFQLANQLMSAFVASPRSSLDYYYPLFRYLINKYPLEFKKWLLFIVDNVQLGKDKLDHDAKRQFVNKLMLTRGQRMAHNVLKDFWLASWGLSV